MKRNAVLLVAIALIAVIGMSLGCSKKPPPGDLVAPPALMPQESVTGDATGTPERDIVTPPAEPVRFEDVFFDFDKSNLASAAREILACDAKLLLDHSDLRILIEGHCDERGTVEYNLALGDRRARVAEEFLVRYGVHASRIEIISYGEERPFAYGQNETAWAKNRRAHFVIKE